jgi:hypothetical protein
MNRDFVPRALQLIQQSKDPSIHPVFQTPVTDVIYCFPANEIRRVIQQRRYLEEHLPPALSFQEILILWEPLGFIKRETFPVSDSSSFQPLPYSFFSKYSTIYPDKLGPDFVNELESFGRNLIWMDLCSMFQQNDLVNGYDYVLHAEPVVHNLVRIMRQAKEGCMMLKPSESRRDGDPLGIKFMAQSFALPLKKVIEKMLKVINDFDLTSRVRYHPEISYTTAGTIKTELINIKVELEQFVHEWFPTDDYFGRLWCYVERLGMRKDAIYVYPG